MDLVERVITAAETALADHQYASFIDVLTGMGLLHNVQAWHNGRVQYLDEMVQGSPEKLLKVIEMFQKWAAERRLRREDLPPHAAEVPHNQPISGSGAGFPPAFCLAATGGKEAGEASRKGQRGGAAPGVLHREGIEVFAVQSGTVEGRTADYAGQPAPVHGMRGPRPPRVLRERRCGANSPRH